MSGIGNVHSGVSHLGSHHGSTHPAQNAENEGAFELQALGAHGATQSHGSESDSDSLHSSSSYYTAVEGEAGSLHDSASHHTDVEAQHTPVKPAWLQSAGGIVPSLTSAAGLLSPVSGLINSATGSTQAGGIAATTTSGIATVANLTNLAYAIVNRPYAERPTVSVGTATAGLAGSAIGLANNIYSLTK